MFLHSKCIAITKKNKILTNNKVQQHTAHKKNKQQQLDSLVAIQGEITSLRAVQNFIKKVKTS